MRLKTVFKSGILAALGIGLTLAGMSYQKSDASLNTVGGVTHNWLGKIGAYSADILAQCAGWAGWIVIIALLAWSAGVWFGKKVKIRLIMMIPVLALGCLLADPHGGLIGVWMNKIPYMNGGWVRLGLGLILCAALIFIWMVPVKRAVKIVAKGFRIMFKMGVVALKWMWRMPLKHRCYWLLGLYFVFVWMAVLEYVGALGRGVSHIHQPVAKSIAISLLWGYPYALLGVALLFALPMVIPAKNWTLKPVMDKWAEWMKTLHKAEKVVEPLKKVKKL
ncbi:MAG: DNA translocase FtsK 4TM domain-containing protein [Alphaproteobacteria bacterium]|nr:DNA translocase FtsK 4TM domain-containing protein [Alphaproteobacteria bacterium]